MCTIRLKEHQNHHHQCRYQYYCIIIIVMLLKSFSGAQVDQTVAQNVEDEVLNVSSQTSLVCAQMSL